LSESERLKIEEKMKTDQAFAQEVALYQSIEGGLRLKGNKALKAQLNEIHNRVVPEASKPKVRQLSTGSWLAIAASIALLILAGYFLLGPASNTSDNLFAAHYERFEWNAETRSTQTDELQQLTQLYNSQNTGEFLQAAENGQWSPAQNPQLALALGSSYLEQGQYEKAIQYFETASTNTLFESEAQWYLALTYLKQEKTDKTIEILQNLEQQNTSFYANKAQQLLDKLD
jgi:tetratricopeptide (TPR) repeat protein